MRSAHQESLLAGLMVHFQSAHIEALKLPWTSWFGCASRQDLKQVLRYLHHLDQMRQRFEGQHFLNDVLS
jgi:hypothetical protein